MKLSLYTQDGTEEYEFEVVEPASVPEAAMTPIAEQSEAFPAMFVVEDDFAEIAGAFCDEAVLASISGVPEVKVVYEKQKISNWPKIYVRVPVVYTRTSRQKFILKYCIDSKPALKILQKCAKSAALAAIAAAAIATPASAVPALKGELTRCLIANGQQASADSLSLRVLVDSDPTEWKRRS